jgi:hypothetical protein
MEFAPGASEALCDSSYGWRHTGVGEFFAVTTTEVGAERGGIIGRIIGANADALKPHVLSSTDFV